VVTREVCDVVGRLVLAGLERETGGGGGGGGGGEAGEAGEEEKGEKGEKGERE